MLSLKTYLYSPRIAVISLLQHFGGWLPDVWYLRWMFRLQTGRKLHLRNPVTYCEKLQWLKLYNRRPEYVDLVDKYAVKRHVAEKIGEEYVIPTLGVWDTPEEIAWDTLPDQFVLKTTHGGGGGGVVICKDKTSFDKSVAIRTLRGAYDEDVYKMFREWPYKYVKKRIIAEKYLSENDSDALNDYKFYCFDGEPKVMLLASDRFTAHHFDYYDMDFNPLPIKSAYGGKSGKRQEKPELFEEMKDVARKMSCGMPHVRVDLYCLNRHVYFGELTFFDASGYDNNSSEAVDREWGSWIRLPEKYR